jgi:MFS family permease
MPFLIAARAIAGMGAGGVTTTSSVVMSDLVPLKNRGLLQGLTNIVFGLGSGLGGPIGGFLNDTLGWKQAFLIQLPLLAVAYILIFVFLENRSPKAAYDSSRRVQTKWQQLKRIDILGSLTLLIGVSSPLIALSLMSANDRPASDPMVLTGLVLGPVFIAAFVFVEAKVAYMPILPLRLLKQRTGLSHALANFFLVSCTLTREPGSFTDTSLSIVYLLICHAIQRSALLPSSAPRISFFSREAPYPVQRRTVHLIRDSRLVYAEVWCVLQLYTGLQRRHDPQSSHIHLRHRARRRA